MKKPKPKKVRRVVLGTGALSLLWEDNMGSKNALIGVWDDAPYPNRRRRTLDAAEKIYGQGYRVRLIAEVLEWTPKPSSPLWEECHW